MSSGKNANCGLCPHSHRDVWPLAEFDPALLRSVARQTAKRLYLGCDVSDGSSTTKRQQIWTLLNGSAPRVRFDSPAILDKFEKNGVPVEHFLFAGSHGQSVPACFMPPTRPDAPAVLYCHAHGGQYDIGMQELLDGRPALTAPYFSELAARGWAVLSLEMPTFGARQKPDESTLSKAHFWRGTTLFGQMLSELAAGIDYLVQNPLIDSSKIAAFGISMGGTHAWWISALDSRVKAAVSMCCFADLECLIDTHAHDGHGHYMTVPGLLQHISTGQLAGLAAPRAQLHCVGGGDWSTPPACFDIARQELRSCYLENPANVEFHFEPEIGHEETPKMRQKALGFLTNQFHKN